MTLKDILLILFFSLAIFAIWAYETKPVPEFNIKPLQDSINTYKSINSSLSLRGDSLEQKCLEYEYAKGRVKVIYKTKYIFIEGASVPQLDSIIRGML